MIHTLSLRWSNAYLLTGIGKPVLVDTGSPGEIGRIRTCCRKVSVNPNELALILQTHVHSDHFGNTAELARTASCPVICHAADQPFAEQGSNGRLRGVGAAGTLLSPLFSHGRFPAYHGTQAATDGMRLDEFGIAASVLHTPGHTPGSISIVLDTGDAIVGDLLMGGFAGGLLWSRKPGYHYFADDLPQAMRSLDRVLQLSSGRLFVGHGGPLQHADVAKWRSRQASFRN